MIKRRDEISCYLWGKNIIEWKHNRPSNGPNIFNSKVFWLPPPWDYICAIISVGWYLWHYICEIIFVGLYLWDHICGIISVGLYLWDQSINIWFLIIHIHVIVIIGIIFVGLYFWDYICGIIFVGLALWDYICGIIFFRL